MAIYDQTQDPTKLLDPTKVASAVPPPSASIFGSGMQSNQDATAPRSTGIVGAQSQQLDKPMGWQVTDDQTVEGRINRIISAGSPLQQQAKSRSLDEANRRGLANTSMAITAGESALYDAALPIAQADAATFGKAAGYNADQTNQFQVRNAEVENQFKLQDRENQQQKDIALINRETQTQLTTLDANLRAQAAQVASQNERILQTNAQANTAYQQAVSAVSAIQNNNQMDAATKTQAVASIWRDLQTQMRVMESVAGLNLTSQLNFANYPGFDANGLYVGFDASGNTAATAADAVAPGGVATAGTATAGTSGGATSSGSIVGGTINDNTWGAV